MGAADEVRAANAAFYRAFYDGDVEAMDALWATESPVACMHPGMQVLIGRDRVMESWRGILGNEGASRIACTDVEVHVLGETAYVTCLEGQPGRNPSLIATNLFVREEQRWKLVHHQAAPISPYRDRAEAPTIPDPRKLN